MHDPTVAKAALRRELRARRRDLDAARRAAEQAATCATLTRLLLATPPAMIASYAALPDELDLADFHTACWRTGVAVLLPRVVDADRLAWHGLANADDAAHLRPGAWRIPEPDPDHLPAIALPPGITLVVPGVGFAADGRRLGQGGGFYDRLLAAGGQRTIGVGFACQLVGDLPCAAHDRRLDALVIAGRLLPGPADTTA